MDKNKKAAKSIRKFVGRLCRVDELDELILIPLIEAYRKSYSEKDEYKDLDLMDDSVWNTILDTIIEDCSISIGNIRLKTKETLTKKNRDAILQAITAIAEGLDEASKDEAD